LDQTAVHRGQLHRVISYVMSRFADLLRQRLTEAGWSERQLATRSSLARGTIRNWVSGVVDKPRNWRDLVRVAAALRLDVGNADELLQAAQCPPLTQLWPMAEDEDEQALFAFWRDTLPRAAHTPPFQAIPDLPYFVGRKTEIAVLEQWLRQDYHTSVYTLCGMAGVGKTALAAHLVYRLRSHFHDGVLWVRVDTADAMSILMLLAAAYGHDVSAYTTAVSRSQTVRGILAHKRALLVLDNVENSQQVELLLPPNGPCAVLITTRQQNLKIARGAPQLHVQPFDEDDQDALALFRHILGAAKTDFEQETLCQIARLLGHLPLALAIAAGRVAAEPTVTATNFLHRLKAHHTRLDAVREEGQSVRSLFDMSCESLALDERRFFVGLGVFAGEDFTLEAAAAINDVSHDTAVSIIGTLSCRSLVQSSRNGRYRLHPLLHDYAHEKITDPALYQRMATYFIDFIESTRGNPTLLESDIDNALIALETAFIHNLPDLLIRGIVALFDYLETHGLNDIAWKHLSRAAKAARTSRNAAQLISILNNMGKIAENRGDYDKAEHALQEGLQLARQQPDKQQYGQLLLSLGQIMVKVGKYDDAQDYYHEGLAITSAALHAELHSSLLQQLGILAVKWGNYEQAETYYQQSLKLARQINHRKQIIALLQSLGSIALRRDAYDQAEIYYQEGLTLANEINYQARIISLSSNMGVVAFKQGYYERSERYYQEGLTLARALGYRDLVGGLLQNLGEAAAANSHYTEAEVYFQEALAEARAIGYQELIVTLLNSLASLAIEFNHKQEAASYLAEAFALAQHMGNTWLVGHCCLSQGKLSVIEEKWIEARKAFQQALEIGCDMGVKELEARSRFGLAQVAFHQNDIAKALHQGEQSLADLHAINHHHVATVANWLRSLTNTLGS
jgi:tetratricopeptide (TPR) repeat protein/transcriptional regulator with XRE-family HTH domain